MSSRLVIAAMAGSVTSSIGGRGGAGRPPRRGRPAAVGSRPRPGVIGDHEQRRVARQLDRRRRQRGVERPVRGQHPAVDLPVLAGPGDRGQLRLQRGPERQVHEGRQRLAGRVPGREPEQRGRPVVRPPDRAVLLEQEQGGRGALEGGVQQPALGRCPAGRRAARRPGPPAARPSARTASASMAPSSSVRAASTSDPGSAPGRPTAWRSASRRAARSVSAPSRRPTCGICPPSPHCRCLPSQVQDMAPATGWPDARIDRRQRVG